MNLLSVLALLAVTSSSSVEAIQPAAGHSSLLNLAKESSSVVRHHQYVTSKNPLVRVEYDASVSINTGEHGDGRTLQTTDEACAAMTDGFFFADEDCTCVPNTDATEFLVTCVFCPNLPVLADPPVDLAVTQTIQYLYYILESFPTYSVYAAVEQVFTMQFSGTDAASSGYSIRTVYQRGTNIQVDCEVVYDGEDCLCSYEECTPSGQPYRGPRIECPTFTDSTCEADTNSPPEDLLIATDAQFDYCSCAAAADFLCPGGTAPPISFNFPTQAPVVLPPSTAVPTLERPPTVTAGTIPCTSFIDCPNFGECGADGFCVTPTFPPLEPTTSSPSQAPVPATTTTAATTSTQAVTTTSSTQGQTTTTQLPATTTEVQTTSSSTTTVVAPISSSPTSSPVIPTSDPTAMPSSAPTALSSVVLDTFLVSVTNNTATTSEIVQGLQTYLSEQMMAAYPDTFLRLELQQVEADDEENRRRRLSTTLELVGEAFFLSSTTPSDVAQIQAMALQDPDDLTTYLSTVLDDDSIVVEAISVVVNSDEPTTNPVTDSPTLEPSITPASSSAVAMHYYYGATGPVLPIVSFALSFLFAVVW